MALEGTQALRRVLSVLRCFTNDGSTAYTLSDIVSRTDLTPPTAHRMLKVLVHEGFLVRDEGTMKYRLGPVAEQLARQVLRTNNPQELVVAAGPLLEALRARSGETVGLHCRVGGERLCLAELESPQSIRMATGVGHVHPLHAGAAGKVLLAFSDQRGPAVPETLDPVTPHTIARRDQLLTALAQVRSQGYAVSVGEAVEGAAALAAPVLGTDRTAVAALYVTGPSFRLTDIRIKELLPHLLAAAETLQIRLAHDPTGSR